MCLKKASRLTQKGMKRKQDVLNAALKLFCEKGYHATTMDEIAKEAGTGKGTVYWYWKSKEDIFLELLDVKLGSYLSALERTAAMPVEASDKVPMLIAEVGNIFARYRKLCKILFLLITEDANSFSGDIKAITESYYRRFKDLIAGIIAEGIEAGTISRDVNSSMISALLIAILDGIVVQETIFKEEYSLGALGASILKLLKQGIYRQ
jgi:AcrR family transcriptional regulator